MQRCSQKSEFVYTCDRIVLIIMNEHETEQSTYVQYF